jgi:hypothetical protein
MQISELVPEVAFSQSLGISHLQVFRPGEGF